MRFGILIDFFKELFFDKKEEAKITSSKFNARKFTLVLLFICLISSNSFAWNRMIAKTRQVQDQQDALAACYLFVNPIGDVLTPLKLR